MQLVSDDLSTHFRCKRIYSCTQELDDGTEPILAGFHRRPRSIGETSSCQLRVAWPGCLVAAAILPIAVVLRAHISNAFLVGSNDGAGAGAGAGAGVHVHTDPVLVRI